MYFKRMKSHDERHWNYWWQLQLRKRLNKHAQVTKRSCDVRSSSVIEEIQFLGRIFSVSWFLRLRVLIQSFEGVKLNQNDDNWRWQGLPLPALEMRQNMPHLPSYQPKIISLIEIPLSDQPEGPKATPDTKSRLKHFTGIEKSSNLLEILRSNQALSVFFLHLLFLPIDFMPKLVA